jgi:processive 1,2-diacylglycerol beta-glucosyltransferase
MLDFSRPLSLLDSLGRAGDLKLRSITRWGYRNLQRDSQVLKSIYRFIEITLYDRSKMKEKLVRTYGRPDIIVSIQPEVNVVAQLFKSWFPVPYHTVIIDLAIHGLWINKFVDNYYVANEPLKNELMSFGIDTSRITVTGMPLRKGFSKVRRTTVQEMRKQLGLTPELKTVLLIGGLLGRMLDFDGAIRVISDLNMPIQIIAVFGANEKARNRARELKDSYKYPMHLYRTVANMHELMWASDIVISKPGSVTMAEVLSLGKPLVAINPLAGSAQELRFAQFLEANEAGVWIKDTKALGHVLSGMVRDQEVYKRLSHNAKKIGRYGLNANKTILGNINRCLEKKEEA